MNPTPKVFESEYRFCLLLWEMEPVKSAALVRRAEEALRRLKPSLWTVFHSAFQ